MSLARQARSLGKTRWIAILACLVASAGTFACVGCGDRGRSGAELATKPIPELPSDASRWVNGAPISLASRDKVLFIEAWHPA